MTDALTAPWAFGLIDRWIPSYIARWARYVRRATSRGMAR
jgi:hypothetical protein